MDRSRWSRSRRERKRGARSPVLYAVLAAALAFASSAGAVLSNVEPGAATSVAKTALINGDSVTTGDGILKGGTTPISLEQFAAEKLGYTVTVVTGAQWDAMTKAQFANFQLLIVGDPFCSITPTSATSNASTWAPVVMGTAGTGTTVGNRVIVGTDPEDHYAFGGGGAAPTNPADPTTAGAERLVQDGIAFAGGVSGATGIYFDTSCGDNGSDIAVLNSLSASGTGFTEDAAPPCGGSVQLIAANPAFASLTDADIQGWECSDHLTFPTFPADWQPLAVATDTATHPTCGTDPNTHTTACGEAYVLVAGVGIVVTAPDLSLTPATHTDTVGGDHTVTAKVTQGGSPSANQLVTFAVTGQNNGVTGTCVPASCKSNASGIVTFTYHDVHGAGTDTINASVTIGGTTEHANATETWGSTGGDRLPPTCVLSGTLVGPPKAIQVTVGDTGSGLKSIVVTTSTNATTPVPAFSVGQKTPVVVTATKINQALASTLALRVTDVAGNVTNCDPTLTTLSGSSSQTIANVAAVEHYVTVSSDNLAVTVVVNGHAFSAGQGTLDVASAIVPGNGNTIELRGAGAGSASVLVWEGH
jgi:hypothetical protein